LVVRPRWDPDGKTDWPTDGRNITLTLTLYRDDINMETWPSRLEESQELGQ
jgi:hypothetical protein